MFNILINNFQDIFPQECRWWDGANALPLAPTGTNNHLSPKRKTNALWKNNNM